MHFSVTNFRQLDISSSCALPNEPAAYIPSHTLLKENIITLARVYSTISIVARGESDKWIKIVVNRLCALAEHPALLLSLPGEDAEDPYLQLRSSEIQASSQLSYFIVWLFRVVPWLTLTGPPAEDTPQRDALP